MTWEDEYDEEVEQLFSSDPDNFYDVMRDDSGCELWNDLKKLHEVYVVSAGGYLVYFKGNSRKFWENVISLAECELKNCKDEKVVVE